MNHFEFNPDQAYEMQLKNWAAEVAKKSKKEDPESYPIITRKRSKAEDLFFETHQFKRRGS